MARNYALIFSLLLFTLSGTLLWKTWGISQTSKDVFKVFQGLSICSMRVSQSYWQIQQSANAGAVSPSFLKQTGECLGELSLLVETTSLASDQKFLSDINDLNNNYLHIQNAIISDEVSTLQSSMQNFETNSANLEDGLVSIKQRLDTKERFYWPLIFITFAGVILLFFRRTYQLAKIHFLAKDLDQRWSLDHAKDNRWNHDLNSFLKALGFNQYQVTHVTPEKLIERVEEVSKDETFDLTNLIGQLLSNLASKIQSQGMILEAQLDKILEVRSDIDHSSMLIHQALQFYLTDLSKTGARSLKLETKELGGLLLLRIYGNKKIDFNGKHTSQLKFLMDDPHTDLSNVDLNNYQSKIEFKFKLIEVRPFDQLVFVNDNKRVQIKKGKRKDFINTSTQNI